MLVISYTVYFYWSTQLGISPHVPLTYRFTRSFCPLLNLCLLNSSISLIRFRLAQLAWFFLAVVTELENAAPRRTTRTLLRTVFFLVQLSFSLDSALGTNLPPFIFRTNIIFPFDIFQILRTAIRFWFAVNCDSQCCPSDPGFFGAESNRIDRLWHVLDRQRTFRLRWVFCGTAAHYFFSIR